MEVFRHKEENFQYHKESQYEKPIFNKNKNYKNRHSNLKI